MIYSMLTAMLAVPVPDTNAVSTIKAMGVGDPPSGPVFEVNTASYSAGNWVDSVAGVSCTLGSTTTFDPNMKAFKFDAAQSSLITCPFNHGPTAYPSLTVEVEFYVESYQGKAWIFGHDNGGYDRSLILNDNRYGGMGSGIGGTYSSGFSAPSTGQWHTATAVFQQGVQLGSFITLDGVGSRTATANNGNGETSFTLGGLKNYGNHGFTGYIRKVRIFPSALTSIPPSLKYVLSESMGGCADIGAAAITTMAECTTAGREFPDLDITAAEAPVLSFPVGNHTICLKNNPECGRPLPAKGCVIDNRKPFQMENQGLYGNGNLFFTPEDRGCRKKFPCICLEL